MFNIEWITTMKLNNVMTFVSIKKSTNMHYQ